MINILQIGAAGIKDHVYTFCSDHSDDIEKLILVEPLPDSMKLTKRHYDKLPIKNIEFVECAIISEPNISKIDMYIPGNSTKIKSVHASVNPEHLIRHGHETIASIEVAACRINQILEKFDNIIDYMFLDTEGLDADIIFDIDFDKFKIKNLRFEYIHMDGPFTRGEKYNAVIKLLTGNGYVLNRIGKYDMIANKS